MKMTACKQLFGVRWGARGCEARSPFSLFCGLFNRVRRSGGDVVSLPHLI